MFILGDLHGTYTRIARLDEHLPEGIPFLQVGDFGWYPQYRPYWNEVGKNLKRKLYWIDGNHEYFPEVPLDATEPVEVAENIIYVPRGYVLTLEGKRIGCMGGGASIDYKYRKLGMDWFLEENITPEQFKRVDDWKDLDLIVTHCPPQHIIDKNFPAIGKLAYGVGIDWSDPNASLIQKLHDHFDVPLICGHMHKSVRDGRVQILNINELIEF